MTSADVTRRTLSLGARDAYTGWCSKVFTETTVKALLRPKGASYGGIYAKYSLTMFTKAPFYVDDEVVHAGKYYHVDTVEEEWRADVFEFYQCGLTLSDPHYDRTAAAGTFHLDTQSVTTDVAQRQKHWIDEYLAAFGGDAVVMLGEPDYLFKREFIDNDLDAIACITVADGKPIHGIDKKPYAFDESALIKLRTTDKAGVVGRSLLEKFEQAIKHVATDHPLGSIRQLTVVRHPDPDDKGGCRIYQTDIQLRYLRANDDYPGTTDTLTYGSGGGAGTFTFPNIIDYDNPFGNRDNFADMPGRQGDYPFLLGAKSDTITIMCNLDMEPHGLTWKRSQTGAKTDSVNWQVFKDIVGNGGVSETSQVLTVAGESHAVRLKGKLHLSPDNSIITLYFTEYNPTPASTNYKTRHGIT
jgi:hypothetical protein